MSVAENQIRIVLDAMGGDNAPQEPVKGAVLALLENAEIRVILTGDEALLERELAKYESFGDRVRIVHTTETIEMAEPPVAAVRSKKDSSMVVGMKMLREGEADAFVSAGSTGAVLAGGQIVVRKLPKLQRAALAPLIPTAEKPALLIDCGANVDARPSHLVQFAHIGAIYMESVMGVPNPRVALVNIGAEEEKGNQLTKETYPLLAACDDLNFIGNIEARDIPKGAADVIVTEAFAGNIILKLYEGVGSVMIEKIREGMMQTTRSKIGALLAKPALKETLRTFDVSEYGGAPLLGLAGLVVKTHGSSTAVEFRNTILQCIAFKKQDFNGKLSAYLARAAEDKTAAGEAQNDA